ncbi:hypothetical protein L7F22_033882 [Adiantum nelumboides]|nr:hypothetical protein [Adiantum nelumboides]
MPFDTTPGQVLSSVPSSSEKRRSSKLGGCAGVLFQIFHGKRLFPRKSLPAERPTQAASNFTDDKLPIAKLLLIADENRSGSVQDADEEIDAENRALVKSYEEKAPRRTPGVVARLMGLESMPSPDSGCGERKQCELQKNMDYEVSMDAPQPDRHTSTAAAVQQFSSLQGVRSKKLKTDLPSRFAACQTKKVQDGTAKSKFVAKSPSLPPHHLDASFPSSPKCDSLNKNTMRIQKSAHLLEAAPKMLKANLQASCQAGSPRLQSSFFGTKTLSLNPKSPFTNSEAQTPCSRRDEVKAAQVSPRHTSNDMVSRRQIADSQNLQLTPQHVLNNSKCSSQEAALVNRKHGFQRVLEQPKADLTEKFRSNGRRQDETRRRLSQPTVCSSFKARPSRHPSPPKSFQDSSGGACSSQASNCMPSSSAGGLSSHLLKSHVGSNNVPARKHFSSSGKGSLAKLEDVDDVFNTMQPLESKYDKVGDLRYGTSIISKVSDASHSADPENSLFSQDGSTSSAIYTESLQRSSLESSISSDPSLSEFSTSSEECSNFSSVGEFVKGHKKLQGIKITSDVSLMESSSKSLSESLNVSSTGHIASSHTQSDDNSRSVNSAHTYSGRNTAAILQELLTALSSSTQKKSGYAKKVESAVSSSLDSEPGNPLFLSAGYGHCKEELSMESTFQDSASSTSPDGSQLSQGNEKCEMDQSVTSKDCASISEMQVEDGYLLESPGKGRTQHPGLSRDCEALMSTLSKLHCIDPEVIGLKMRTQKDPQEQVLHNLASPLSGCLTDSDKAEKQTQQLDHGLLSSSSTLLADDDAYSIYRSDVESSLINGYNEVAVWNKKLVTDCINEAFKCLSKQLYNVSSALSEPPSATHVLSRVYKQLDDWKAMSSNMNLDDIIEKEMNLTTRSWRNIGSETEEVAEVVESTIFSGLLEEVLLEIM